MCEYNNSKQSVKGITMNKVLLCDKLGHKTYIAVYLGEYLPHLAETRI